METNIKNGLYTVHEVAVIIGGSMEETKTDCCKMCGQEFTVRYQNHKYCCYECRMSYSNWRKKEIRKGVYKNITKTSVTMDRILELMDKLSKEQGRVVQYGEVQKMLLTGRIKL